MHSRQPIPELIVAAASAAWGLYWLPLRALESRGLEPAWATLTQFAVPLLILLPIAAARRLRGRPSGLRQVRTGLLIGSALAFYFVSLLLTDVARALILFYAMPAWGTALEVGFMGRPFTRWRAGSLLLGLAGMLMILGLGRQASPSLNLGDLMALLSGLLFAMGALEVRRAPSVSIFEQVFGFFLYGSLVALALSRLPLTELGRRPSVDTLVGLAPWLALLGIGFLIPVMWGIYWGSRSVDPGRLGVILQIEAVVGIGSAALLAGEPFGVPQAVGAGLVISAGLVEVIGQRSESPPKPR